MANTLTEWLNTEIEKRTWSNRELARRAGLASSTVSDVLGERTNPGFEFCKKIASALGPGVSPELVLRKAGLLPPEPDETRSLAECHDLFAQLTDEAQIGFLAQIRAVLELQQNDDKKTAQQTHRTYRDMAASRPGRPVLPTGMPAEDGGALVADKGLSSAADDYRDRVTDRDE